MIIYHYFNVWKMYNLEDVRFGDVKFGDVRSGGCKSWKM